MPAVWMKTSMATFPPKDSNAVINSPYFLVHLIYNQYNQVYGWTYRIFVFNAGCNFHLQFMQSTQKKKMGLEDLIEVQVQVKKHPNITPGL